MKGGPKSSLRPLTFLHRALEIYHDRDPTRTLMGTFFRIIGPFKF